MQILPMLLLALLGGERVLDDFQYADALKAQSAWTAGEGSAPVDVVREEGRPILRLNAPFATQPKLRRAVADRKIACDLVAPSGFLLEAELDDPDSIGGLNLYFRSGGGWYSSGKPITKKGWQTLRFSKSSFAAEGNPDGWDKIDAVRLSAWRPSGKNVGDTNVRFRRLSATWSDVALIVPSPKRESPTARDAAHRLQTMLDELGLDADPIDENAAAAGALGRRRVAVLSPGFTPNKECIAAIARFLEGDGKLVVYSTGVVPDWVRETLQITNNISGQFVSMENGRGAVIGPFPSTIGRDARNRLGAMLARLVPSLWKEIVRAEFERAGRIGHYRGFAEALEGIRPRVANSTFRRYFNRAEQYWKQANDFLPSSDSPPSLEHYLHAIDRVQWAHDSLVEAYLLTAESLPREGRAVWNHSGTGAWPGDWERSAKLLGDNGFNMVLPNMLWGGVAHYASDVLPRSATFQKYGDQIEQCCAAAKKHNIEVHVWKVNFNLLGAPKDFVEKMRRAGRTQVTVKGEPADWLCPSHPENQKLELDAMLEVARKYPVDGLHFDYIRYPGRDYCYCDGCRRRFEAASGRKVADADWPKACFSGTRKEEYNDWRCGQITALVAAVSREAKKVRPGLKISAAVFGSYPGCRESVAQDWPSWIKAGYLDFVCPMDYAAGDAEFASLVRNQVKLIEGRVPLYAGIGATATGIQLSADRVVGQILLGRSLGAGGFSIFNFDAKTAESIVPGVGAGVGAKKATPPHDETAEGKK